MAELAWVHHSGLGLVNQLFDFSKDRKMTIDPVGWEYINGMKSLRNLINLISKALEMADIPIDEKSSAWESIGFYVADKRFWVGLEYARPEYVCFSFRTRTKYNAQKFRSLGKGRIDDRNRPYFELKLHSEENYFFSRTVESQLSLLQKFFEQSFRDAQVCLPPA